MDANGYDYDVAVIGGGSAGYAAARTMAPADLRVVVVEGGDEVGGLCILRGCMPSKALLQAAEVMQTMRRAPVWGLKAEGIGFDFKRVMARKDAVIREFAEHRAGQLMAGRFDFVRAQAWFEDPHTLVLSHGQKLRARQILIATGSRVAELPLRALGQVGCLDSDGALRLEQLPESLVVLGGGAVALEFAQFFARLGVRVTLVQRSPHVLKHFDADAARALESALRREEVEVYTDTRLRDAWRNAAGKGVVFECQDRTVRVAAEEIFHGLGRVPNTTPLRLENAGVQTEGGRIVTNDRMQTSVPHIYAAGDCTGPHEIVHVAVQQGEIAAHNLIGAEPPRRMDYRLLTVVVFTSPQVAVVGLTEKAAQAAQRPYEAASYPFNDHGKSIIMDVQDGMVKLLADPQSGEILGGCCVGPEGGELIHEIVVAMAQRMTVGELAAVPHYHPTLAEIWTYPAEELAGVVRRVSRPATLTAAQESRPPKTGRDSRP